jgi:hypothetical protein
MKLKAPGERISGNHWGLQWTNGEAECPEGDLLEKLLGRGYIPASGDPAEELPAAAEPKKKRTARKPKEA